uniref:SFRICE_012752 n=1 Tax=Spodoptera frugiperda TaxID=7108 RepID=A0A2H1WBP7_SPOFR
MDESIEDSPTLNDSNTINEDIGKERTDDGDGNVKELDHLNDHDYFTAARIKPSKATIKKQCKRLLKITQIKAVYNCKSCGYRTMKKETFKKHHCGHIKTEPCTKCDSNKVPKGYKKCPNCTYISRSTVLDPALLQNEELAMQLWVPHPCEEAF